MRLVWQSLALFFQVAISYFVAAFTLLFTTIFGCAVLNGLGDAYAPLYLTSEPPNAYGRLVYYCMVPTVSVMIGLIPIATQFCAFPLVYKSDGSHRIVGLFATSVLCMLWFSWLALPIVTHDDVSMRMRYPMTLGCLIGSIACIGAQIYGLRYRSTSVATASRCQ